MKLLFIDGVWIAKETLILISILAGVSLGILICKFGEYLAKN